jgi:diadenosine tetraphosphate (Ap4A) HIT family hydrolase
MVFLPLAWYTYLAFAHMGGRNFVEISMSAYPILPIISPMTEQDRAKRRAIDQRCAALIAQGICPSCQQLATGDVFLGQPEQTYYQDDLITCHLESYPRGAGHTILVARTHYADIAEMPVELGSHIMHLTQVLVNALKTIVAAEKVYVVTMCSGAWSHLHFQLIPRRPGELMGGRVFASERGVLTNYQAIRAALVEEVHRRLP